MGQRIGQFQDTHQLINKNELDYYAQIDLYGDHPRKFGNIPTQAGNYQFVPHDVLIDNFMVAYVGQDKVISNVNKLDVKYHTSRAIQEFTYDILKSYKGWEFILQNNLNTILPQDFVAYTQVSWVDDSGIKHPIRYTNDTSNPYRPYQSQKDTTETANQYMINAIGTATAGEAYVKLDGLYPELHGHGYGEGPARVDWLNENIFNIPSNNKPRRSIYVRGVYHDKASQCTYIEMYNTIAETGGNVITAHTSGEIQMSFITYEDNETAWQGADTPNITPGGIDRVILFDPVFDAWTSGATNPATTPSENPMTVITAPSPGDVANIRIGMKADVGGGVYYMGSTGYKFMNVTSVDYVNGKVYLDRGGGTNGFALPSTTTPPNMPVGLFTACPSITFQDMHYYESDRPASTEKGHWPEQKSRTLNSFNGESTTLDKDDPDLWKMNGQRYGLDTSRANINGTFYIDKLLGKMRFSSDLVGKTIVIDYISDGVAKWGEVMVHKFAEEAIYKWVAHAILASKANMPEYLVNRFKKERFAEMRKAKLRLSNIKPSELSHTLRGRSKQIKH